MSDIVQRNLAWTCFATPKGRLTRCEHLNAQGGRKVPKEDYRGRPTFKIVCERCGADFVPNTRHAQEDWDKSDLARRSTVREIVSAYERTEAAIRASFAAIAAAEDDVNAVLGCGEGMHRIVSITASGRRWGSDFRSPEDSLKEVRRDIWRVLVDRLRVRSFMSIQEWEAFSKQIEEEAPPPITQDYIEGWASALMRELPQMHERAIHEVFEWLRPKGWQTGKYKTNDLHGIGERMVIESCVESQWGAAGRYQLRDWVKQRFASLESVFATLDGAGALHAPDRSELAAAIKGATDGIGETTWLAFKCFRNHNLHLRFKRPDLVAKINRIAGGNALRGKVA